MTIKIINQIIKDPTNFTVKTEIYYLDNGFEYLYATIYRFYDTFDLAMKAVKQSERLYVKNFENGTFESNLFLDAEDLE